MLFQESIGERVIGHRTVTSLVTISVLLTFKETCVHHDAKVHLIVRTTHGINLKMTEDVILNMVISTKLMLLN